MNQGTGLKSFAAAAIAALAFGFAPSAMAASITEITALQRYPWTGQFDITYKASGIAEACGTTKIAKLKVWAVNPATHVTNVAEAAALSGDTMMVDGTHSLVWDMDAQGIFHGLVTNNLKICITAMAEDKPEKHDGVQLWADGPYFATTNIGAENPQDYGYHFWWGDTVGYTYVNSSWKAVDGSGTIQFSSDDQKARQTCSKSIATLKSDGWIDTTKGNLVPAHDAATAHWGSKWRTMTKDELDKLVDTNVCMTTWTTQGGVNGRLVKGNTTGYKDKEIFLPAAGMGQFDNYYGAGTFAYYMTSTPTDSSSSLYLLHLRGKIFAVDTIWDRCYGYPVRPVSDDPPSTEVAGNGNPEPLCTGEYYAAADLRTGEMRNAAAIETLVYTPDFFNGGDSVTIMVNDTAQWTGLTGSGMVAWTPDPNVVGTYTLSHNVYDSNKALLGTKTATFYSPKEQLSLKDAKGNTVDVKLNRSWVEEKTGETDPAKQAAVLNVKQANQQMLWENEILGLTGSDPTSKPVISPIQLSDPRCVGFRLSGVNVDTTSGASVSNKVWKGATPGAHTTPYGPYLYTEQVDVPVPESGIQYYDIEVLIK